jgi:hypothetical protein
MEASTVFTDNALPRQAADLHKSLLTLLLFQPQTAQPAFQQTFRRLQIGPDASTVVFQ